jgi:hypothetical protein
VPWTAVDLPEPASPDGRGTNTLGWLKAGVPYLPPGEALSLQTLDLWIPTSATGTGAAPDITSLPGGPPGSVWIIYIHGGAWRDPRITSASFTPAATNLLLRALASENNSSSSSPSSHRTKLAGLVSLNYRLSPHPSHPSSDPARRAKHPDHISDILTALSFLSHLGVIQPREANNHINDSNGSAKWILAGHSCGATLSFQTLMPHLSLLLSPPPAVSCCCPPSAVVGFNGLYDLAGFIARPPESHAHLREGYREFTVGAFGEDESVWRAVCPASCEPGWVSKGWVGHGRRQGEEETEEDGGPKKIVAVLVQSRDDQLVPWQQLECMRVALEREGPIVQEVRVREARGEHDEIWREGGRMAEVLWEVVEGL